MTINLNKEALTRLAMAGYEADAVQNFQGFDALGFSDQQLANWLGFLEEQGIFHTYGGFPVVFDGDFRFVLLIINKEAEDWEFEHEMYQGKYPLAMVIDPSDPESSQLGYLNLQETGTILYSYPQTQRGQEELNQMENELKADSYHQNFVEEAEYRLKAAGIYSKWMMKFVKYGETPFDFNGIELKDIRKVYRIIDSISDGIGIYFGFSLKLNGRQTLIFLIMGEDADKWCQPHEMLEGKYPLALVVDLEDPAQKHIGFFDFTPGHNRLIKAGFDHKHSKESRQNEKPEKPELITEDDFEKEIEIRLQMSGLKHQDIWPLKEVESFFHSKDIFSEIIDLLAGEMNTVIYGGFPCEVDGDQSYVFLLIDRDEEEWEFEHEMYLDKYPMAFVVNADDPQKSSPGYLCLQQGKGKLYPYPQKETEDQEGSQAIPGSAQQDFLEEAEYRASRIGINVEAVLGQLRNGEVPFDYSTVDDSRISLEELAPLVEIVAEKVGAYFGFAAKMNDHDALGFLIISSDKEKWIFPHEMYQDQYPLTFMFDLADPDQSKTGISDFRTYPPIFYELQQKDE